MGISMKRSSIENHKAIKLEERFDSVIDAWMKLGEVQVFSFSVSDKHEQEKRQVSVGVIAIKAFVSSITRTF